MGGLGGLHRGGLQHGREPWGSREKVILRQKQLRQGAGRWRAGAQVVSGRVAGRGREELGPARAALCKAMGGADGSDGPADVKQGHRELGWEYTV